MSFVSVQSRLSNGVPAEVLTFMEYCHKKYPGKDIHILVCEYCGRPNFDYEASKSSDFPQLVLDHRTCEPCQKVTTLQGFVRNQKDEIDALTKRLNELTEFIRTDYNMELIKVMAEELRRRDGEGNGPVVRKDTGPNIPVGIPASRRPDPVDSWIDSAGIRLPFRTSF